MLHMVDVHSTSHLREVETFGRALYRRRVTSPLEVPMTAWGGRTAARSGRGGTGRGGRGGAGQGGAGRGGAGQGGADRSEAWRGGPERGGRGGAGAGLADEPRLSGRVSAPCRRRNRHQLDGVVEPTGSSMGKTTRSDFPQFTYVNRHPPCLSRDPYILGQLWDSVFFSQLFDPSRA